MAKAAALVRGRDYVLPEDVSLVFGDVVPHRLLLSPGRRPTAPSTLFRSCWSGCPPPGSPDAMAYRRIAYAALLGGAVLFQIVFRFYLSTFTLALVLLLPLLSVLLSLPVGAGLHTASHLRRSHGGTGGGRGLSGAAAQPHPPAPAPASGRLHWSNQLTRRGRAGCRWEPCAPHRALRPLWSWPPPTAAG